MRHPTKVKHYEEGYKDGLHDAVTALLALQSTAHQRGLEKYGDAHPFDRLRPVHED